jgi:nucleoside-diphosphate-sugar epimerase
VKSQINAQLFREPIPHLIVTGSNGFVGQAFLDYIEALPKNHRPEKITLISRAPISSFDLQQLGDSTSYVSADLTKEWHFSYPGAHLLNLAADGSSNSYGLPAAINFELINTNLVNWAMVNKPHKIIHASTGACFGVKPLKTNDIDHQFDIVTSNFKQRFIESRIFAEQNLHQLRAEFRIPVTICRLFSFVGIRLLAKKQYAFSSFIDSAVKQQKIFVKGNPQTTRSFLDEQDMSAWLWSALNSPATHEILSIGSSRGATIGELAHFIAGQTDSRIIFEDPNAFGDEYVADNSKTLDYLNVSESKLWEESTLECLQHMRGLHERG